MSQGSIKDATIESKDWTYLVIISSFEMGAMGELTSNSAVSPNERLFAGAAGQNLVVGAGRWGWASVGSGSSGSHEGKGEDSENGLELHFD